MSAFVSVNFEIIESGEAMIPALSAAAIYGRSAFTSLAFANNQPFLWESHFQRLSAHCRRLSIEFDVDSAARIEAAVRDLVKANGLSDARVRVTVAETGATRLWPFAAAGDSPALIIAAEELSWTDKPMKLGISEFNVNTSSPLTGIKSGNYLEQILCVDDARERGYDEAVRTNEHGELVSACLANLFWVENGIIFTPPLSSGCLAGTIRGWLIDEIGAVERASRIDELKKADEMFLTSSGIGLRPAFFEMRAEFPIADRIRQQLLASLRNSRKA